VGYVVCPSAVTPVELATATAEASISLPISGTPTLGDFAIAAAPDGRSAYVDTADGVASAATGPTGGGSVATPAAAPTTAGSAPSPATTSSTAPSAATGVRNVVIPIDLVTQKAGSPITIPGQGATHAIVVMPDGHTVLAASGSTVVPVDATTRRVGTPLDLGPGRTVFGLALNPTASVLYALVPGGVIPIDTAHAKAAAEIPTGLTVSSVYSPHGLVVSPDGIRIYVVGQGGPDFGGRVVPIVAATGATLPATGFDHFGIADPAAIAVTGTGGTLLVADAANNWVNLIDVAAFATPVEPARLPPRSGSSATAGTQHPTDIVVGPGDTGAFVVDGFSVVVPYAAKSQVFGPPIPVCSGASSMTVAPAP
jgi:hypothetical protein